MGPASKPLNILQNSKTNIQKKDDYVATNFNKQIDQALFDTFDTFNFISNKQKAELKQAPVIQ